MSERWGLCRPCDGEGQRVRVVARELISTFHRNMTTEEAAQYEVPEGGFMEQEMRKLIYYPCAACDGTGFSGDALER